MLYVAGSGVEHGSVALLMSCAAAAALLLHRDTATSLHLVPQVLPGAKVPADGEVVQGSSYVDESMVTGEPLPVHKRPGAAVLTGTVNGSGTFRMRAARVGENTLLKQVSTSSTNFLVKGQHASSGRSMSVPAPAPSPSLAAMICYRCVAEFLVGQLAPCLNWLCLLTGLLCL